MLALCNTCALEREVLAALDFVSELDAITERNAEKTFLLPTCPLPIGFAVLLVASVSFTSCKWFGEF